MDAGDRADEGAGGPGELEHAAGAGLAHGVALRSLPSGTAPVLDPLGQLVVQQQVVPLNTDRDVDTYDGAPVAGPRRFQVGATLNGQAGTAVSGGLRAGALLRDERRRQAGGAVVQMMDAGLVLGVGAVTFDPATIVSSPAEVQDEQCSMTATAATRSRRRPRRQFYTMPVAALKVQRPSGAAARAPVRRVGRAAVPERGRGPRGHACRALLAHRAGERRRARPRGSQLTPPGVSAAPRSRP